ncbi:MAG: hypothetical protein FJ267_02030 [Planctomycetes bacterium]|nr:hypothetical protein [Planctomycetota bacterium]
MLRKLWNDESGVIISAELALVLTIAVLAMVVGLSEVAVAVNTELNDISNAIGALNQSYSVTGFKGTNGNSGGWKWKSWALGPFGSGFGFQDAVDDCDCNTTCDIVCGAPGDTPHQG